MNKRGIETRPTPLVVVLIVAVAILLFLFGGPQQMINKLGSAFGVTSDKTIKTLDDVDFGELTQGEQEKLRKTPEGRKKELRDLLKRANGLYQKGDIDSLAQALTFYEDYIKKCGSAVYKSECNENQLNDIKTRIAQLKTKLCTELLVDAAQKAKSPATFALAKQRYEQAEQYCPAEKKVDALIAKLEEDIKSIPMPEGISEECKAHHPNMIKLHECQALVYIEQSEFNKAEAQYKKITSYPGLKELPEAKVVRDYGLASLQQRQGKKLDAYNVYEDMLFTYEQTQTQLGVQPYYAKALQALQEAAASDAQTYKTIDFNEVEITLKMSAVVENDNFGSSEVYTWAPMSVQKVTPGQSATFDFRIDSTNFNELLDGRKGYQKTWWIQNTPGTSGGALKWGSVQFNNPNPDDEKPESVDDLDDLKTGKGSPWTAELSIKDKAGVIVCNAQDYNSDYNIGTDAQHKMKLFIEPCQGTGGKGVLKTITLETDHEDDDDERLRMKYVITTQKLGSIVPVS